MKEKMLKFNAKSISIILILIMLLQVLFSTMLSVYAAEPDTTWQNDWEMTLDDENGIIMIGKYNGTETKYKVPSKAIIDGKEYATVVGNSGSIISNSQVEELSFEEGVKICPSNNGLFTSNKLTKIDFNGVDFSDVTSMSGWFSGCSNLKEVDLSNIKADNLTAMSSMFENCTNLKSANLSEVKLNKLENTENMFKGCTSLTSVNMKGFSAANVTNENHMFANCTGLKEIEVEGLGIICSGLEEVEDEEYGYTYYEKTHIFDGCTNLKHLKLKNIGKIESGSLSNTEFGEPQITIEELTLENCKVDKGAFNYCNTITKINFKGQNNVVEEDAFYVKPGDRRNLYTDYKDGNGKDRKSWKTTVPTSFLPTEVNCEDSKLDNYNWGKNNRLIADDTEYNITYNLNGGNGSTEKTKFSVGDCIKAEVPTREEYNFYGWNTKENGAGKIYMPNEQILVNEDLELFAQWRKKGFTNEEKTAGWAGENVRWEYNDGTIRFFIDGEGDGKMYNQVCGDQQAYSSPWANLNIKNIKFEDGITYIGTYALSNLSTIEKVEFPNSLKEIGSGAFYMTTINEVSNLNDATKFGIHPFTKVTQMNDVVLNANGGKFENNEETKTYTTNIDLNPGNIKNSNVKLEFEEPTKEGFKFIVWNTRADGSGKDIQIPYYPSIPQDSTYYAIWTDSPITVTYNKNGGEFGIASEQLYKNDSITNEEPTKDGYLFAEWNTKKDGTGKAYWPGDKIDSSEDITLYAIYGKKLTGAYITDHEGRDVSMFEMTDGDGNTIAVYGMNDSTDIVDPTGKEYVEVSQEYLKKYINNNDLTEDEYNKLKTLIATAVREYDEAGLESSLGSTDENYKVMGEYMIKNMLRKVVEPLGPTSISGYYWNSTRDLRIEYVMDHFDEVGSKYNLRVFKSPTDVFLAIEPRLYEVAIAKTDILDQNISGAQLQIIDKNGNIIKEWNSGNSEETVKLTEGTYTLKELSVPNEDAYVKADDITFYVSSKGIVTIADEEKDKIAMIDEYKTHEITISKTGLDDKEIAGAELEVTGKALGREADIEKITWTTEAGKSKMISLEPGTYTLHESKVPDGYIKSEDITFKVDIYGKVTIGEKEEEKVVMKNDYTKVDIEKVDEDGNLLAGATLQILDKDGNVVEEWKSEEKAHSIVAKLVAGEKYTLHELYAPEGYEVMENVEFTVSEDGSVDKVKAVNKKVVVPETPKEEEKEEPVEESKEEIKEEVKEEPVEEKQEEKSPQTGDKIAIAFAVLAIGVAGVVVTRRRK